LDANQYGRLFAMALLALFGITLLFPSLSDRVMRPLVGLGVRLSRSAEQGAAEEGRAVLPSLLARRRNRALVGSLRGPSFGSDSDWGGASRCEHSDLASVARICCWGSDVARVQIKNVEIPPTMQRAMAQEAEALREKRARLIKAEAELDAADQLRNAAQVIMQNPAALELRRMQMITEVGAEQNTMTIVMMPSEFVSIARGIGELASKTDKS
jgi:regulator of protease activity HflC (stomatin/prohibitin superfamily)